MLSLLRAFPTSVRTKTAAFWFHHACSFHSFVQSTPIRVYEDNVAVYYHLLRECAQTSNLQKAQMIHAKFIKLGFACSSLFLCNHLINGYVKCGDIEDALKLFNEMPQKNVVSWTALIAGLVRKGFPLEALNFFSRMHSGGTKPNEFTFVSAIHACSFSDSLSLTNLFEAYAFVVKLGFESNVYLANAFITALIKHCLLHEALRAFHYCLDKDTVSWNAVLWGYLHLSCPEIPGFWRRMISQGVLPDNYSFATILTGLAELSDLKTGMQVHALLVKAGHGSETFVGNTLLDMYLKNLRLSDGFKAFDEIFYKDVNSWTQMAAGCLHCGEPMQALWAIREMRNSGIRPNKFTLATALSACANLANLAEGEKVHCLRIKLGDKVDVSVDNALLDMYVKCGCVDAALLVFWSMGERNVVSWTTMIMGYALNGHARDALGLFHEMKMEGVKPNEISFTCVLYACAQGNLIDEGLNYFSTMIGDHGILPQEDHYACMVNLLGRAGRIKEAEELIRGMPSPPGVLVWQTLLGGCQLHGDTKTAIRAAQHAMDMDKNDPSTYVLLSNTFSELRNWDNAEALRSMIKRRNVNKMPGSSWIEYNNY